MPRRAPRVLVIGGGITGLCCAHRLLALGCEPVLLEAADRVGGRIRTVRQAGLEFEAGPNTLLDNSPALNALIDELRLRDEIVPASPLARKRYVLLDGRLMPIPMGPVSALTSPLLGLPGLRGILGDVLGRRGEAVPADESVASFVRRRLGDRVMDRLVGPFLSGVYAGDPERLEARSVFPTLVEAEEATGSIIRGLVRRRKATRTSGQPKPPRARGITFRDGLSRLPERIADGLGGRVCVGERVETLRRTESGCEAVLAGGDIVKASHVVIACESRPAAQLVREMEGGAPIAGELEAIESSTVAVVGLAYRRDQVAHPLDGFGYLVGPGNKGPMLGCLFRSSIFPASAPSGTVLLACFLGGAMQDVSRDSDERMVAAARADVEKFLGVQGQPATTLVFRWNHALPQANRGHAQRRARIEAWCRRAGSRVSIISSSVYGAPLPKCIETGRAEAERVAALLREADPAVPSMEAPACVPA